MQTGQRSPMTEDDLYLFNEGSHFNLYDKLGAHVLEGGTQFAVWAPNCGEVSVVGDFNGWNPRSNPLRARGSSGIWDGFVEGVGDGMLYKYHLVRRDGGWGGDKSDPVGFQQEVAPKTGSIVTSLDYAWGDSGWMAERKRHNSGQAPWSIYELHLGSWMRVPEEGYRSLSYRELAPRLIDHLTRYGFTHVEMLPVMEHPFFGSWGYQVTGFFAPTSRYGAPQDFMYLVDQLHQAGIGVILDWVPSHFPTDAHGLGYFDGTHLYEHADARLGFHPDWKSYIFNYGRHEVRAFLISSALFWLDRYHADGLRVDAVASMLYLDYSRRPGEWIPNSFGGRENLEAISLLRRLNEEVYARFPDVQTMAEESTAWPMVSRPTYVGGLGFGMKWDMGWMHDTLGYFERDPVHRRFHHNDLTFRAIYQFNENFVLPLSHDEVVHGKGSLLNKMPGDVWQKFANLRTLYSYMWACPGKNLLFMGGELAQWSEWNHDGSLDWHLEKEQLHSGVARLIHDLNALYRERPALYELDFDPRGFEWVDANDWEQSVLSFLRLASDGTPLLAAFNLTPIPRPGYRLGVPRGGRWAEIHNSDAEAYGGSGWGSLGGVEANGISWHGRPDSIDVVLPPLAAVFFSPQS